MTPPLQMIAAPIAAGLIALTAGLAPTQQRGADGGPGRLDGPVLIAANQGSGSATIISVASGTAIAHVPVGTGPHEVAASPDGRTAVVTVYGAQTPGHQLAVIDIATAKVTQTIDLGEFTRPHGAAFLPDGKTVFVTSEARQAVVVVDLEKGAVAGSIPTGNPGSHMLAMPSDKQRIYTANIGNGSVSELDIASRTLVRCFPVATRTEGIGVAPDGSTAWVGSNDGKTVTVVDIKSGAPLATFDGFGFPYRVGFSSDGAVAVVTDPNNDEVRVYDAPGRKELGRISIGAGTGPVGVNFAPDSRIAYISLNGGNGIAEIDVTGMKVLRRFDTEIRPDGVVYVRR